MVKEARCLTPQAVFHISMAESLPLSDSSTDLVFSTTSFHHWQDQLEGVQQITRVLRPGGIFVLVDIVMLLGIGRIHPHGRQTAPSKVREMFAQTGLEIQNQRRVMSLFLLVTVGRRAPGVA